MSKKIYFLGGKLNLFEREKLYDKYKPMLRSLVNDIGARAGLEFKAEPNCTRARFSEIWRDSDTYGIFWFGHGTPGGLPATNEAKAGGGYETLNPMLLGKSTTSLKFIALLSCFSGKYKDEWLNKLGSVHTQVKTFESTLEGGTGPLRADIERWIENKTNLVRPTSGASGLLQYTIRRSIWDVPTTTPLVISSDYFPPDHVYVKTVIIPKVGSNITGKRPLPGPSIVPKPVIKKPSTPIPLDNWGFKKTGGKWDIGKGLPQGKPWTPPGVKPGGSGFPGPKKKTFDSFRESPFQKKKKTQDQADWLKKKSSIEAAKSGLGKKPGGFRPQIWPPPKGGPIGPFPPKGGDVRPPRGDISFGTLKIKYPGKTVIVPAPW